MSIKATKKNRRTARNNAQAQIAAKRSRAQMDASLTANDEAVASALEKKAGRKARATRAKKTTAADEKKAREARSTKKAAGKKAATKAQPTKKAAPAKKAEKKDAAPKKARSKKTTAADASVAPAEVTLIAPSEPAKYYCGALEGKRGQEVLARLKAATDLKPVLWSDLPHYERKLAARAANEGHVVKARDSRGIFYYGTIAQK